VTRLAVDAAVRLAHPGYRAVVLVADGVANGASDERSLGILRAAEARARELLAGRVPAELPRIAAWRAAFAATGLKPSRFPSSAEALLKRVARGDGLPAVNRLVDVYNAVSVAYGLPLGGEDADRLVGTPVLRPARAGDVFDLAGPDGAPDPPRPGEVVWVDDAGVTCRAWNWRQGVRTRIREDTRNAFFLLEAIDEGGAADLEPAVAELEGHLDAIGAGGARRRYRLP
jgi:DNA/RNA-binding domain of Phe-tRNA-synthetase-like protein